MIHVLAVPTLFVLLLLDSMAAEAAEKNRPAGDDLDVTMQIILDPDAKLPDEVIHRIAVPARKPPKQPTSSSDPAKSSAAEPDAKGQERAKEAKELGSEMSERAKERAQDANDQREAARRAIADEKGPKPDKPPHPDPPRRPPH